MHFLQVLCWPCFLSLLLRPEKEEEKEEGKEVRSGPEEEGKKQEEESEDELESEKKEYQDAARRRIPHTPNEPVPHKRKRLSSPPAVPSKRFGLNAFSRLVPSMPLVCRWYAVEYSIQVGTEQAGIEQFWQTWCEVLVRGVGGVPVADELRVIVEPCPLSCHGQRKI
jgi:hypothetical protein